MVVQHVAGPPALPDVAGPPAPPDSVSAYWRFHEAVARARLVAWLPQPGQPGPGQHKNQRERLIVDVSGPRADSAEIAAIAGHPVIRVLDGEPEAPPARPGRLRTLIGDTARLDFLPEDCADGVIAFDRALSTHLAAEAMVAEITRILRPGGRVLACVDSLVLGMAMLAEQHQWANLVDLPNAEVVLVPWPDGSISRCYGPDHLQELFSGAGLTLNWVRPLTVFSQSMVTYALRQRPGSMAALVRAELGARPDDSFGAQLMVSATRLLPPAPASVLGLALNTPGGIGQRLEPALGDIVPAVDAMAVALGLDPGQRREYPLPLPAGGVQYRLGPVVLRQAGASVGQIRSRADQRFRARQIRNRPVQLVTHLLQALAENGDVHSSPRLPWAAA
jgi:hypothetical protein